MPAALCGQPEGARPEFNIEIEIEYSSARNIIIAESYSDSRIFWLRVRGEKNISFSPG